MKHLFLIRHAKSSWSDPAVSDFDRKLNKRGKADAPFMARRLAEREISVDCILSSPAKRARKTTKVMAGAVGYAKKKIIWEEGIYDSAIEDLYRILHMVKNDNRSVVLVGHNYGLTDFAEDLLCEKLGNIPTSGIVALDCKVERWDEVARGCATLVFFDYPKRYYETL